MKRQKLIDRLNDYIDRVDATLAALADLPDLENGHLYQTTNPGELQVRFPLKDDSYKRIRRRLGRAWVRRKESENPWTSPDGSVYYHFYHRETGVELVLNFDPVVPGSTCHRVKVGERVEPIYEIVCN